MLMTRLLADVPGYRGRRGAFPPDAPTRDLLADRSQDRRGDDDAGRPGRRHLGAAGRGSRPDLDAGDGDAARSDRPGGLGGDPPPLSFLGEVRLRSAVRADGDPVIHIVGHDRGICQQVPPPRARASIDSSCCTRCSCWAWRGVAGRDDRDAVRRLGAGRASRPPCWSRTSRSGPAPARNGLWVWVIYRVSDAALLLAAVAMHHLRGEGDFDVLLGSGVLARRTRRSYGQAGARRGTAAAGGGGRQVGADPLLGLAARAPWKGPHPPAPCSTAPLRTPRGVPAAEGQPASSNRSPGCRGW